MEGKLGFSKKDCFMLADSSTMKEKQIEENKNVSECSETSDKEDEVKFQNVIVKVHVHRCQLSHVRCQIPVLCVRCNRSGVIWHLLHVRKK